MAKKKRFVKIVNEALGVVETASVYVDRETGVHYLLVQSGNGTGLTPLLNEHGAPVIGTDDLPED